jgi:hypothetical protein
MRIEGDELVVKLPGVRGMKKVPKYINLNVAVRKNLTQGSQRMQRNL